MKVLFALIAVVMVTGCELKEVEDGDSLTALKVFTVRKHDYVVLKSGYSGGIVHAAHCPCQDSTKGTTK